jgi:hypothetical protein
MSTAEPLPTCRRKALLFGGLSLATLLAAWGAHAASVPVSPWVLGLVSGFGVGGLFAAGLLWWMPDNSDAVPKRLTARYHREIAVPLAGYFLAVAALKPLLQRTDAVALRTLVSLLPAMFVLGVMRAFVRYVRDSDELQRRIELEAGAVAGLLISAAYLAAGFLQTAKLIAIPSAVAMLWVFPMLCFSYGFTKVVIARRYL